MSFLSRCTSVKSCDWVFHIQCSPFLSPCTVTGENWKWFFQMYQFRATKVSILQLCHWTSDLNAVLRCVQKKRHQSHFLYGHRNVVFRTWRAFSSFLSYSTIPIREHQTSGGDCFSRRLRLSQLIFIGGRYWLKEQQTIWTENQRSVVWKCGLYLVWHRRMLLFLHSFRIHLMCCTVLLFNH